MITFSMATVCTLTDLVSWVSCVEYGNAGSVGLPLTEGIVLAVWVSFFLLLVYNSSRQAFAVSSFIAVLVSGAFLGLGLINPMVPIAAIIFTALGVVLSFSQTNS